MAKLFCNLTDCGLYQDWAFILDWLFDDSKFDNWSPNHIGQFTKKVKKLPCMCSSTYKYSSLKNLRFPKSPQYSNPKIYIAKKDGEAKDIVRHIRNGIAHGKAKLIHRPEEAYIEICDYNASKAQSAYILMPVIGISQIFQVYAQIKKAYCY